jgi:hypothetical protein
MHPYEGGCVIRTKSLVYLELVEDKCLVKFSSFSVAGMFPTLSAPEIEADGNTR